MYRRSLHALVAGTVAVGLVVAAAVPAAAGKDPKTGPGFDGNTITLGVVTPLSGTASVIGLPLTAGNKMWWDYYNEEKGGIAGKYKVELVTEDSQYKAEVAIQAYDRIKGDVAAFQQILGTQVTKPLLPKLQADRLGAAPATLDALWVHNPNLFPIGAPYQVEAINALDYYVTEGGGKGKKVCAIAQDDEFGEAGLEGLASAKKSLKLKVGPTPKFAIGADVTAQVQELVDGKCDAVLVVATPLETSSIFTKAVALDLQAQMIALAPSWLPAFAQSAALASYLQENVWIAAEKAIAWGDTSVPGMSEFLTRQQEYAPSQRPDPYFIFGYLQGQALAQILEKAAKNGDLSPAGIVKAAGQMKKLTFGDFLGDYIYGPAAKRKPPRTTALFKVDPTAPVGLALIEADLESAAAKKYKIER